VALVALLPGGKQAAAQGGGGLSARPTLVVLVTVDQMRGDYLDRFGGQLTGGLARLSRGGAWYTNAHHDHAITETAPGHATLLSGRFPRSTGIMMNSLGVADTLAPLVTGTGWGASPRRFAGTTLVDWLHAADARSRALSVSMKDRGAILPVGRSKGEVYWYSPDGQFTTSRYYRDSLPPWVVAFNARHLPQRYAAAIWSPMLADSAYREPDSVAAEGNGVGGVFPHILPSDSLDAANVARGTPFMDELEVAFALRGLEALSLGRGPQTDVLALSLSATDLIGHRYGPDSREMHDQILRLDRLLGRFLDSLYRLRDSSRVLVVLTGDHGAGTMPELAPATMRPVPTHVSLRELRVRLDSALMAAKVDPQAIDLEEFVLTDRAAFRRAGVDADSVLAVLAAAIRSVPGVARVDDFHRLLADTLRDPIARRWAHQFPANAKVELVVTLTPLSLWGNAIASHGSPYDYDSHVPLIFYGAGVRPGRHGEFVRTVDLAPTLGGMLGVQVMERLDGKDLKP
jgi:predicted AlkP superfamily pyrophosphatase or phosphodiesterase